MQKKAENKDLERLVQIRKEREEAAKRRAEEQAAKDQKKQDVLKAQGRKG